MSAFASNPFYSARDQLVATITPHTPASYKTRIFALFTLSILVVVLGVLFIVLTVIDLRKRGKSLQLVRLQKTQAGRLIVVNALFIYCACAAVGGIVIAIARWRIYETLFLGASKTNMTILSMQTWSPEFIGGLAYTHSNLSAIMSLSKQGHFAKTTSRAWVWIHNLSLMGGFAIYFYVTIPLGVQSNTLANHGRELVASAIALLTEAGQALESGSSIVRYPAQIAALQAEILAVQAAGRRKGTAIIYTAATFCIIFAVSAVASLSFVTKLRSQSKWNRAQRNITQASVFVTREQQTIVEVDGPGAEPFSSSPTPPLNTTRVKPSEGYFARAMPFSGAVKKQPHDKDVTETAEHAALTRLAYNLSLSLPLILSIGLLFPILGFIGLYSKDTSFAMTELRNDAFAWVDTLANLTLLSFFCIMFWYSPGRYTNAAAATHSEPVSSGSKSRSFQLRMQNMKRASEAPEFDPVHLPGNTSVRLAVLDDAASGHDVKEKADKW